MIVNYDGKEYTLDLDELTTNEAKYIKHETGMTLLKLQEGLLEVDPDALTALYWLMMKQSGISCDMRRVDFKIVRFSEALINAISAESGEEDEDEAESAPKAE